MTKQGAPRSGAIQNVFVLLLLAIFACMAMLLVTLGAQVYRTTVDRAEDLNARRVVSAVVRSSLWTDEGDARVYTESAGELEALAVEVEWDGERYVKRLYARDGYLYESLTAAERPFTGEEGDSLCTLDAFRPSVEDGLVTVRITLPGGQEQTVALALRAPAE